MMPPFEYFEAVTNSMAEAVEMAEDYAAMLKEREVLAKHS
jgi:hypothetical protein